MQDRRQNERDRVLYGALADINGRGPKVECVVRNISRRGACVELDENANLPDEVSLNIPRKGRSFVAKLIWRQAGKVGLAFRIMTSDTPFSSLDDRLRKSEIKKRQLQRRIDELLG